MTRTRLAGAAFGILLFSTAIFTSCSAPPAQSDEPPKEFFQVIYQKDPDGRTVMCFYKEGRVGGHSSGTIPALDCDFENAIVHK